MEKKIKFKSEYPYVIVCEGKDEYSFLIAYLTHLEQNEKERFVDCHNVVDFGGINDMNKLLNNTKRPSSEDDGFHGLKPFGLKVRVSAKAE